MPYLEAAIPEKRKPLTSRQIVKVWDACAGKCYLCGLPIERRDGFVDEHIIPLALSGSNDLSNRTFVHVECAKQKTKKDQGDIARAYHVRLKHIGGREKKFKRSWGYGRNDKMKKKVTGEVVPR